MRNCMFDRRASIVGISVLNHIAVLPMRSALSLTPHYCAAGHGMEWNGTEILVWNMEDVRTEWKVSRME